MNLCTKHQIRSYYRKLRNSLIDQDRQHASDKIKKDLLVYLSSEAMGKSIVVAGYVPIDGEVNIIPLMKSLHDLGHIILAPIDSQVGCFSLWRDVIRGSQLVDDYIFNSSCVVEGEPMFGGVIAAPYMHCRRVCIDFKNVVSDMFYIIAPLISYDKNLNRLGFGKGWYDKTVFMLRNKNKTVKLIGVAYKEQYCDSIPKEPHDVPLDYLCVS